MVICRKSLKRLLSIPLQLSAAKFIIEDNVFIGPYAVIRADETNEQGDMEAIVIKRDTNISRRCRYSFQSWSFGNHR